jgi:hypothetical protein
MFGNADCAKDAEESFKLGKRRLLLKAMLAYHGEVETGRQAEKG